MQQPIVSTELADEISTLLLSCRSLIKYCTKYLSNKKSLKYVNGIYDIFKTDFFEKDDAVLAKNIADDLAKHLFMNDSGDLAFKVLLKELKTVNLFVHPSYPNNQATEDKKVSIDKLIGSKIFTSKSIKINAETLQIMLESLISALSDSFSPAMKVLLEFFKEIMESLGNLDLKQPVFA